MKLSIPDPIAKQHSERLCARIRQDIIESGGAIPFARFMELALYAPGLGYYMAGQQRFGKQGDFVTAPLISPLFARTVAVQCKQVLSQLPNGSILEIGAGSGNFASDLLSALKQDNGLPDYYFILEVSADLRKRQQVLLKQAHPDWFDHIIWLDQLPKDFVGVIFANEVLDALPVNIFRVVNDEIKERYVAFKDNQFVWQDNNASLELQAALQAYTFSNNYLSEVNLFLPHWIKSLTESVKQGVLLFFDYGYGAQEFYHPDRTMGTLKCYYQHHHHDNPLILIGLQDITAHVNFTAVADSALDAGLSLVGYTTQAAFLMACGLLQMAEREELDTVARIKQQQAIKKLLLPSQMGEAIKVIALSKQIDISLLGFSLQDRRCDL